MKILILINNAPYGSEQAFNAMRIANNLSKYHQNDEVRIYLTADAVSCAVANQITPNGYYNIARMLKLSIVNGAKVKICESCSNARGIMATQLIDGAEMSSISELTNWIVDSDRTLVF